VTHCSGRVRRRKIARADALRADMILRAADGLNNCEIADAAGVTRQTVRTWCQRLAKHRLDDLDDEPRCGAPRKIGDDRIEDIVARTLETNLTAPRTGARVAWRRRRGCRRLRYIAFGLRAQRLRSCMLPLV